MIAIDDLKHYVKDNQDFIGLFRDHESILFTRLVDVLKVLHYICDEQDDNTDKPIDSDLEVIFETGFSYLHEQLELIKIYYEKYFNKDFHELLKYEHIINFLLYLDDLAEALTQQGYYKEETKNSFSLMSTNLERILQNKEDYSNTLLDEYNTIVESHIPHKIEILTTDSIFAMIVDEIE